MSKTKSLCAIDNTIRFCEQTRYSVPTHSLPFIAMFILAFRLIFVEKLAECDHCLNDDYTAFVHVVSRYL